VHSKDSSIAWYCLQDRMSCLQMHLSPPCVMTLSPDHIRVIKLFQQCYLPYGSAGNTLFFLL